MAGIVAIPHEYFEAARMDGAGAWSIFRNITLPLVRPATATVIILSLIGGLRSFELIWAITKGGPGFTSDVIASVIYKQYQAGFFGLSTAGNVILFIVVIAVMVPVSMLPQPKAGGTVTLTEAITTGPTAAARAPKADRRPMTFRRWIRKYLVGIIAILVSIVVFLVPFAFVVLQAAKNSREAGLVQFTLAHRVAALGELLAVVSSERLQLRAGARSTASSSRP